METTGLIIGIFLVVVIGVLGVLLYRQQAAAHRSALSVTTLTAEKEQLQQALSSSKAHSSEVLESTRKEYEQRLAAQQATSTLTLEQTRREYEEVLSSERERSASAAAQHTAECQELTARCEALQTQVSEISSGRWDERVRERLAEADRLESQIAQQQEELAAAAAREQKAKGELSDREEEIEELEEDIEHLRKRVSERDDSIAQLTETLDREKRHSEEQGALLAETQQELSDTQFYLKQKRDALHFLQEILSAQEIQSDQQSATIDKSIQSMEELIEDEVIGLLESHTPPVSWEGVTDNEQRKQLILEGLSQWSATKRKSWLDGKRTVAFIGEFSAGKTSIVNRILSQDKPDAVRLPVSTKATTAIPTYISHSVGGAQYHFISGDNRRRIIAEETFRSISKEVLDQVSGVSSLIKYFVMGYENENLRGLSILDTPGFNSNDSEDAQRTFEVINECDALFWVFDVNTGEINKSSVETIKKHLHRPLYVVINKVDTKAPSEVDATEKKIRETLHKAGIQIRDVIRFSSSPEKNPLSEIMGPIQQIEKNEMRDQFLQKMAEVLNQVCEETEQDMDGAIEEHRQRTAKVDESIDKLEKTCGQLAQKCDIAASIPQFTEHLFTSDRYEMTPAQGERLKSLLATIRKTNMKIIPEHVTDDLIPKVDTETRAAIFSFKTKTKYESAADCLKRFQRQQKRLNQTQA